MGTGEAKVKFNEHFGDQILVTKTAGPLTSEHLMDQGDWGGRR